MYLRNILGAAVMGIVANHINKKNKATSYLKDKVVLITGGSKGLGVVLAEQLISEKCKIAICARDEQELHNAQLHLQEKGAEVFTQVCDVGVREEVDELIGKVINHYGELDIIINNAGIMMVGPMETFEPEDYQKAMDVMYWGIANTTLSALPYMKERKSGHIVNITSVGGKVSVPHLLPYDASKFAAVGFSEGSAAELRKDHIYVTTIVPWLMRTGSYVNALFQKGNRKEFKLFSFMSSTPLLTISADRAAAQIIQAIKEKKPYKVVGTQAKLAIEAQHFFPNLTTRIFGIIAQLIPASNESTQFEKGKRIEEREENAEVPGIRKFGHKAQEQHQDLNQ
jgi:short-subunit dehydrogenase